MLESITPSISRTCAKKIQRFSFYHKYKHILLIRVISFKSRHPTEQRLQRDEKEEKEGRKSIVDNYGQLQRQGKKKERIRFFITV